MTRLTTTNCGKYSLDEIKFVELNETRQNHLFFFLRKRLNNVNIEVNKVTNKYWTLETHKFIDNEIDINKL